MRVKDVSLPVEHVARQLDPAPSQSLQMLGQLARRVRRAAGHVLRPKPSPTARHQLMHSVCAPAVAQISCERYGCWGGIEAVIAVLVARLALSVSRRGARLPRQLAAEGLVVHGGARVHAVALTCDGHVYECALICVLSTGGSRTLAFITR